MALWSRGPVTNAADFDAIWRNAFVRACFSFTLQPSADCALKQSLFLAGLSSVSLYFYGVQANRGFASYLCRRAPTPISEPAWTSRLWCIGLRGIATSPDRQTPGGSNAVVKPARSFVSVRQILRIDELFLCDNRGAHSLAHLRWPGAGQGTRTAAEWRVPDLSVRRIFLQLSSSQLGSWGGPTPPRRCPLWLSVAAITAWELP